MENQTYHFTDEQLTNLLFSTIGMFIEYRDVHGKAEVDGADICAVGEMFDGLDAEKEMAAAGEGKMTMQSPAPEPVEIEITARLDPTQAHAQIKDRPELWGCGTSVQAAIGNLVMAHQGACRIKVSFPKGKR